MSVPCPDRVTALVAPSLQKLSLLKPNLRVKIMDITRRRNLTADVPSLLLRHSNRFEDLGRFDEEECRFFLREVGERVVPQYPFSFGMEEVYSLILERYGYGGIPDATSVLSDLLESDSTASGFGDDGDVWRSWRHSWRHRNVSKPPSKQEQWH